MNAEKEHEQEQEEPFRQDWRRGLPDGSRSLNKIWNRKKENEEKIPKDYNFAGLHKKIMSSVARIEPAWALKKK